LFTYFTETYFFTATIHNWQKLLEKNFCKQIILDSLEYMCNAGRISTHAFVIMPNHIHVLLTLGKDEKQESFQRDFLKFTAQQMIKRIVLLGDEKELETYHSTQADRVYQIWERRPKWKNVSNQLILEQKKQYIHENPLQEHWKLADQPEDYYWSSASFYLKNNQNFNFLSYL